MLALSSSHAEVDCVPGDLIDVIKLDDDGNQDEDAWLNNSDDDDARPSRRVEAGSGFGGTRLGGGGSASRAAAAARASSPAIDSNGSGNGNGRRSESVVAAPSGGEDDWEAMPADVDVAMADPADEVDQGRTCPACSELPLCHRQTSLVGRKLIYIYLLYFYFSQKPSRTVGPISTCV